MNPPPPSDTVAMSRSGRRGQAWLLLSTLFLLLPASLANPSYYGSSGYLPRKPVIVTNEDVYRSPRIVILGEIRGGMKEQLYEWSEDAVTGVYVLLGYDRAKKSTLVYTYRSRLEH